MKTNRKQEVRNQDFSDTSDSTHQMAVITDLPTELIDIILSDVPLTTHLALLYTCRRLYTLTKPRIYRKVSLYLDCHSTLENLETSKRRLVCLCRTLYCSDVASLVKEFDIQGFKPSTVHPQHRYEQRYSEWFPRELRSTPAYKLWKEQGLAGNTDILIASIIFAMRNMRVLHLDFDFWVTESPCLTHVLSNMNELRHVNFYPREYDAYDHHRPQSTNPYGSFFMEQLIAVLRLPRVESVACQVGESKMPMSWLTRFLKNISCSSLKRLYLERSEIHQRLLGHVLRATPRLEEIVYDLCINIHYNRSLTSWFNCRVMDNTLSSLKQTLRYLYINVKFDPVFDYIDELDNDDFDLSYFHQGIQNTMRSLVNFPNLTELSIPIIALLGWNSVENTQLADVLPRSLRHLLLTVDNISSTFDAYHWSNADLIDRVDMFVRRGSCDRLVFLALWLPVTKVTDSSVQASCRLAVDCFEAGIECIIDPDLDH